jgi:hypothetical protein
VLPCKKPGRTSIKTPNKYTIDINLFVNNSKILKIILVKINQALLINSLINRSPSPLSTASW